MSAKSFATADFNHIASPTLSHPPPDSLPAQVGSWVLVDFISNPSTLWDTHPDICLKYASIKFVAAPTYHSDYKKSFDRGRERYIGEGGSKSG